MRRLAQSVMAFGLVAAACGGDSGAATTTAATTAPTTATTAASTTTAATTTTSASTATWFSPLAAGVCFNDVFVGEDFDFSVPPVVVPCDGPHDNEVVAVVDYPDGDYAGEDSVISDLDIACGAGYDDFFGGSQRWSDFMYRWNIAPDPADWAAGARVGVCVTYAGESVVGTARSAGLTAPGEVLAVLHEVDGQLDVWTLDGGTGELLVNVSNDPSSIQTVPAGWSADGSGVLWAQGDSEPNRRVFGATAAGGEPIPFLGPLDIASIGSPTVDPSGRNRLTVIAAPDGGEFDVLLFDSDTSVLTNLTADNPDRDTTPNWSPDGTKIAYRSRVNDNSDVWVMDADGSNKVRLTTDPGFDGDPRWSPDGTRIAFTSDRTGDYEIWIMDADGSNQQNLTNHPAADEYPTWSPDGSLIAFHSSRHGGISLWIMNADGSEQSDLSWLAPVGYPAFRPAQQ